VVGQGKLIGIILAFAGAAIGLLYVVWGVSNLGGPNLQITGFILGLAIVFIVLVAPLVGGGLYLFARGSAEAKEYAEIAKERKLLGIVQTQGQVRVTDVALEMQLDRDQVKSYVYDLVNKGLFTGYINWDDGILYSKTAKEMQTGKCPNCGGELQIAGKGVIKCPYCGSEIFV
jgi:DNA-directed RNA polymerase subunit RPC12/RpoP